MSLIELMVSLTVGLIVTAAALAIYMTTSKAATDTIRSVKLNQEIRGAADIISNDIRRAGYRAMLIEDVGTPNPFQQRTGNASETDINLINLSGSSTDYECILFSYDATYKTSGTNDVADSGDFFGYRLSTDTTSGNQVVSMREGNGDSKGTFTCDGTTGWEALTDSENVNVESLSFSLAGSKCLNANTGVSWELASPSGNTPVCLATSATGYVAPSSGDRLLESREIVISIAAHHVRDQTLKIELEQVVKVRNDRAFVAP